MILYTNSSTAIKCKLKHTQYGEICHRYVHYRNTSG